jgi:hypothetical protein
MDDRDNEGGDVPLPPGTRDMRGRFVKNAPSANPHGAPPKAARAKSLTSSMDPTADMVMRLARLPAAQRSDGTLVDRYEKAMEELYRRGIDQKKRDTRALIEYLRITNDAAAIEQKHINEMFAGAMGYKEHWGPRFEAAARSGQRPPSVLPHPDDIVINPDATVSFVGPIDREGQKRVEAIVTMQGYILDALAYPTKDEDASEGVKKANRYLKRRLAAYNRALPPRLKKKPPK